MEYTFEPCTKEQWLEFQMEIARHQYENASAKNRKSKIIFFAVVIIVTVLFAFNVFINIVYFTSDSIRSIVLLLSGAFLIWYFAVPRLFFIPSYINPKLEKLWAKSESSKNRTTDTVKIDDGIFTVKQSDGKVLTMPLQIVTGVMQTKNLILVPLYPIVYEIIPKSIFSTPQEEQQFLAALNCG